MALAPPPNPIIGLVIPLVLIIFALWSIRRSSKKRPTFNACPICKENIRFSLGFQRGMRSHFKTVHPEYWRLLKKWTVIQSVTTFTVLFSIFPLLFYNIIPSRGPGSILTLIETAVWAAVMFSLFGVTVAHAFGIRRRFREEWSEKHPLYHRIYGNLRGIEVEIRDVRGKTRIAIMSGLEFLFNPISPFLTHLAGKFIERRARTSRLDRFEDGRLWFYNGFDMLVSLDVKNVPPEKIDEQRIRLSLRKGRVEMKTENSADLNLALSILSPARMTTTLNEV